MSDTTEKAKRLAEELEKTPLRNVGAWVATLLDSAAALLREMAVQVDTLTGERNEAWADLGKGPLVCAQCGMRPEHTFHGAASECADCFAPNDHHDYVPAALATEEDTPRD